MKWIYLVALIATSIGFCFAIWQDDLQRMVMWGILELMQLICLKAEEIKEKL